MRNYNTGNSGLQTQYRFGNGDRPASYPYMHYSIPGQTYQQQITHDKGVIRTYDGNSLNSSQQRWGQWSDWKPVIEKIQVGSANCKIRPSVPVGTQPGFGTNDFTGRKVTVNGGTGWDFGNGTSRSTIGGTPNAGLNSNINNGGQSGTTTTTQTGRRRRTTTISPNNSISNTGTATGTTAGGFESGSVGGP